MKNIYKQLFQDKLIGENQYELFESIGKGKTISLYYELRLILYLGIMLFTGGLGYFAYQNIGEIGHIVSMFLIATSIVVGFYFIRKFSKPYSNFEVKLSQVYFDYILLLVSLLIVTLFAYVQVYFDIVDLLINGTSFISALIFLFMAYRYDNRALLSMGIVAFAAAVGVSITPINWAKGEWFTTDNLYVISLFLGAALVIIGEWSIYKDIKRHFSFTYKNFGLLIYFIACVSAIFDSNNELLYALIMLISAGILSYLTWIRKEFLFFLYSSLAGYIALTYLIITAIESSDAGGFFIIYYFPVTCISYIIFLIIKKSHFSHE